MNETVQAAHTVSEVLLKTDEIFFGKSESHSATVKQLAFREKLFKITQRRKIKGVFECDNVDATAYLTDEEFDTLIKEAESLR